MVRHTAWRTEIIVRRRTRRNTERQPPHVAKCQRYFHVGNWWLKFHHESLWLNPASSDFYLLADFERPIEVVRSCWLVSRPVVYCSISSFTHLHGHKIQNFTVFLPRYVLWPSVCLSLCYKTEEFYQLNMDHTSNAKNSLITLLFWRQISWQNSNGGHPHLRRVGYVKIGDFDLYLSNCAR